MRKVVLWDQEAGTNDAKAASGSCKLSFIEVYWG